MCVMNDGSGTSYNQHADDRSIYLCFAAVTYPYDATSFVSNVSKLTRELARDAEISGATSWSVSGGRRGRRHGAPLARRARAVGGGTSSVAQLGMLARLVFCCRDSQILAESRELELRRRWSEGD